MFKTFSCSSIIAEILPDPFTIESQKKPVEAKPIVVRVKNPVPPGTPVELPMDVVDPTTIDNKELLTIGVISPKIDGKHEEEKENGHGHELDHVHHEHELEHVHHGHKKGHGKNFVAPAFKKNKKHVKQVKKPKVSPRKHNTRKNIKKKKNVKKNPHKKRNVQKKKNKKTVNKETKHPHETVKPLENEAAIFCKHAGLKCKSCDACGEHGFCIVGHRGIAQKCLCKSSYTGPNARYYKPNKSALKNLILADSCKYECFYDSVFAK